MEAAAAGDPNPDPNPPPPSLNPGPPPLSIDDMIAMEAAATSDPNPDPNPPPPSLNPGPPPLSIDDMIAMEAAAASDSNPDPNPPPPSLNPGPPPLSIDDMIAMEAAAAGDPNPDPSPPPPSLNPGPPPLSIDDMIAMEAAASGGPNPDPSPPPPSLNPGPPPLSIDDMIAMEAAAAGDPNPDPSPPPPSLNPGPPPLSIDDMIALEAAASLLQPPPPPPLPQSHPTRSPSSITFASLGLPPEICARFKAKGIADMYPWQKEALATPGVLEGRNFVYTAPTSGGKTLVSELLMMRALVADRRKKVLFVLPYISLVKEKVRHLKPFLARAGLRIGGFFGNEQPRGGFFEARPPINLAVCTIEKANTLVNRLVSSGKLASMVSLIVVDEVHMCAEKMRGYILELMLSKVMYLKSRLPAVPQIVCMSATLPNLKTLCTWLDAALYTTAYRPIPLLQYVLLGPRLSLLETSASTAAAVPQSEVLVQGIVPGGSHEARLLSLVLDVVAMSKSVLIFCGSRRMCATRAKRLATLLAASPRCAELPSSPKLAAARHAVLDKLANLTQVVHPVLARTIPFGFAFHHAGLTVQERSVIESAFRDGVLHTLAATSTLAVGVNLPARRVILDSPRLGFGFLDAAKYLQMCGRAGRAGQDTLGESIMCINPRVASEVEWYNNVLNAASGLAPLASSLASAEIGLTRILLEGIAASVVTSVADSRAFLHATLYARLAQESGVAPASQLPEELETARAAAISWLASHDFVAVGRAGGAAGAEGLAPTHKGVACVASALTPDQALVVYDELLKASQGINLQTILHPLYLATPIDLQFFKATSVSSSRGKWVQFAEALHNMGSVTEEVMTAIGLSAKYVIDKSHGAPFSKAQREALQLYNRFYVPLVEIERKYCIDRGEIQSLQAMAASYVGMMEVFCNRLSWDMMEAMCKTLKPRLEFGVRAKHKFLMALPSMTLTAARILYDAGITRTIDVATASVDDLVSIVASNTSFKDNTSDRHRFIATLRDRMAAVRDEAYEELCEMAKQTGAEPPSREALAALPNQALDFRSAAARPSSLHHS
ncbi:DNA polymerase theta [Thecamonas trahens ATCC 50062]|uniref:DNA polymerase theta n=1 Tax=Thecamonas trahens ATCC 50062 TaxID=461836 RepID=A0A0L0DE00_THETB|nr:DNA polymerase theta [Thecamonas trahens ATCC 50062]KNC49548.1 DNA polymerase theta [Thecamonas trahens ATCC 50062]|eukprot:XP_013757659.1 DNA polymerase theta [Thecamonas trahens ATCC 50062]